MATDPGLSKVAAKAGLSAIVGKLDTGVGANAKIKIFNGTQADSPDDAVFTGTTLAEIDLGAAAVFPSGAVTGNGADANYVVANRTGDVTDTNANAAGTASWFRAVNKSGIAIIDGSVGTAAADLILNSVAISTGQTVKITNWKMRLAYKN